AELGPDRLDLVAQATAILGGDAVGIALEQCDDAVDGVSEALEHDHHVPEARAALAGILALDLPQRVGWNVGLACSASAIRVVAAIGRGLGRRKLLLDALRRPQRLGIEAERACPSHDAAALALLLAGIVRGAGDAVWLAHVAGVGVGISRCA